MTCVAAMAKIECQAVPDMLSSRTNWKTFRFTGGPWLRRTVGPLLYAGRITRNVHTHDLLTPGGWAERATITGLLIHLPTVGPDLLQAQTKSIYSLYSFIFHFSSVSRGLVILLVDWLEGCSPVFNVLSSVGEVVSALCGTRWYVRWTGCGGLVRCLVLIVSSS
jgi:hypothetical protein